MKTIVYVKLLNGARPLWISRKGEWIDLQSNADVVIAPPKISNHNIQFQTYLIPLGVAMKLPAGFEAIIAPRSSTFKTYGLILQNSIGVIDNCYCGPNDEWKFGGIGLKDGEIAKGNRICQFRIQPSQKATWWQKLKWVLSKNIEFRYVDELPYPDRKGFGKGTGAR